MTTISVDRVPPDTVARTRADYLGLLLSLAVRLRWVALFALGVVAFWPVLSMWFVADDFIHLRWHERGSFLTAFTTAGGLFYRPVGFALTWNLGYDLFGTNALPYHLLSLALHALAALLLAKATEAITGETRLGWIAGAIYAVYPLCTEPVAWVADQWDLWAAVWVLGAIWAFAAAWRRRNYRLYAASLVLAALGVFSKEIALPLPALMPFVAVVTELNRRQGGEKAATPASRREWLQLLKRAMLWSIPFAAPTLLFLLIRFAAAGGVGGYTAARTDFPNFFWDATVAAMGSMLMPLNRAVFGQTFVQAVGFASTALLVLGLFVWGAKRWTVQALAVAWWLLFLVPVLNLVPVFGSSQSNRVLHISFMAFAISVASIISAAMDRPLLRRAAWVALAVAVIAFVPVTWRQLGPWSQASVQARSLVREIARVLPSGVPGRMEANIRRVPQEYNDAFLFVNGLGDALRLLERRSVVVNDVASLDEHVVSAPLPNERVGIFNIGVSFDQAQRLFVVTDAYGATQGSLHPPESDPFRWDFTTCTDISAQWQPEGAAVKCAAGAGDAASPGQFVAFTPNATWAGLKLTGFDLRPGPQSRFVRLGVQARLRAGESGDQARFLQLSWSADSPAQWTDERSIKVPMDVSGEWRAYWLYVPLSKLQSRPQSWRLTPADGAPRVDIAWISLSTLP